MLLALNSSQAEKRFGVVDVLINSAGYSHPSTFKQLDISHFKVRLHEGICILKLRYVH